MTDEIIDRLFSSRPKLNDGSLWGLGRQDWGVSEEFGRYLSDVIKPGMRTIETGAGISTLIFASSGARHIAIAPSQKEMDAIRDHAEKLGIDMSRTDLVVEPSERYLPSIADNGLDIVFIDGEHEFPWPMLDWCYTADRLNVGGLMMLDDTQLRSVGVLCDFLRADAPRWKFVAEAGERTDVFEKIGRPIHGVGFSAQPWMAYRPPLLYRVRRKLRRLLAPQPQSKSRPRSAR